MFRLWINFTLFLLHTSILSQSTADWWYFGDHAGVHFTANGPVADLSGQVNIPEGVATISNEYGQLQFYTDGIRVWNSEHDQMPNGFGLLGHPSSTQSGVICPAPGNANRYYIFTVANHSGPDGLRYTVVDMSLKGGLGDVLQSLKNIPIVAPICEKVAVIRHENQIDYWVVTHMMNNNTIKAYLLTSTGLSTSAVSSAGLLMPTSFWHGIGYLKPSVSGEFLAFAFEAKHRIEVFRFDRQTGSASNPQLFTFKNSSGQLEKPYGLEFSPDDKYLYATPRSTSGPGFINQYDLSDFNSTAIAQSKIPIASGINSAALQLGPDGRIYCSARSDNYLHSIHYPMLSGAWCTFVENEIDLQSGQARQGLPTFMQSFFTLSINVQPSCLGRPSEMSIDSVEIDSALWDFGDPNSSLNSANGFTVEHTFSDTGEYQVVAFLYVEDSIVETVIKNVEVLPRQFLDFGPDTTLCLGQELELDVSQPFATILWDDGSVDFSRTVVQNATLSATLLGVCDTLSDTIKVRFDKPIVLNLPQDTSICKGDTVAFEASFENIASILWSTGDTVSVIDISTGGLYEASAQNQCGKARDSMQIDIWPLPRQDLLPPDTINCFAADVLIERPQNDSFNYQWTDGSSDISKVARKSKTIFLTESNKCGAEMDSMMIKFNRTSTTDLGDNLIICDEDSILISASDMDARYLWNTGATDSSIMHSADGNQSYVLTVTIDDCDYIHRITVEEDPYLCAELSCGHQVENVFSPNGDGINETFNVHSDCELVGFELHIFNRWGIPVFTSNNAYAGWDGKKEGRDAEEGTYFYTARFQNPNSKFEDTVELRGSLTLLR